MHEFFVEAHQVPLDRLHQHLGGSSLDHSRDKQIYIENQPRRAAADQASCRLRRSCPAA